MAATCDQSLASIALSEGDHAAAVDALARSDAILAEFGEQAIRSTTQAMLARAHERAGSRGDALAAAELAEELSAPHEVGNFAITHGVRARLALESGDLATARSAADSALAHALRTDFVGLQAEARLGLAAVLHAAGGHDAARREATAALELFTSKGDRPGIAAAQAMLREIPGSEVQAGGQLRDVDLP
jgi:tetratricopeptide (TPR) repeat protein